jgi:hypothetical protein
VNATRLSKDTTTFCNARTSWLRLLVWTWHGIRLNRADEVIEQMPMLRKLPKERRARIENAADAMLRLHGEKARDIARETAKQTRGKRQLHWPDTGRWSQSPYPGATTSIFRLRLNDCLSAQGARAGFIRAQAA